MSRALFGNLAGGHDSIERYRLVFSKAEFDGYFKFCIARNPWDRVHSTYLRLMSDDAAEPDKTWAKRHLVLYRDFADFVERGLTLASVMEQDYFMPQYKFITSPVSDKPLVDFIGRYENLEADFDFVRKRLDKPDSVRLDPGDAAPAASSTDYKDAYTSLAKEIVVRAYGSDIEMFGYKFG
ncbi:MAG: sulfotransferase family 2 domain-containing protein [Gammaproteobacteria bacterium]